MSYSRLPISPPSDRQKCKIIFHFHSFRPLTNFSHRKAGSRNWIAHEYSQTILLRLLAEEFRIYIIAGPERLHAWRITEWNPNPTCKHKTGRSVVLHSCSMTKTYEMFCDFPRLWWRQHLSPPLKGGDMLAHATWFSTIRKIGPIGKMMMAYWLLQMIGNACIFI